LNFGFWICFGFRYSDFVLIPELDSTATSFQFLGLQRRAWRRNGKCLPHRQRAADGTLTPVSLSRPREMAQSATQNGSGPGSPICEKIRAIEPA
jgi:hypothetical protein